MTADPLAVAAALEASLQAHAAAKGKPRPSNWRECLSRAYTLRQQAHSMDPIHESPAWEAEQRHTAKGADTHKSLMAFYAEVCPPPAYAAVPHIETFSEKLHMSKVKHKCSGSGNVRRQP